MKVAVHNSVREHFHARKVRNFLGDFQELLFLVREQKLAEYEPAVDVVLPCANEFYANYAHNFAPIPPHYALFIHFLV